MTKTEIKESLLEQLRLQNKTSDFYLDLVSDYMDYWSLKKEVDYRYPEKKESGTTRSMEMVSRSKNPMNP